MMAFRSATVEENDRTGLSQSKGNQRAPWRLDYPCMAPAGSTSALAIAHPVGEFRHRGMDFGACLGVGLLSFGIQKTLSCRSNRSVARCLFRVRSCNGVIRRSTNRCYLAVSLVLIIDFGAGKGTRVSFRLARKARTLARSAPLRMPPNTILLPGTTREGRAMY